jgi:anthranilate synthase/aminodeoxychorismate synthase-like glutamine amidotransferase
MDIVRELGASIPLLGVCLGHQAICQVGGAEVVRADEPVHGKASPVHHEGQGLFEGLPRPFWAGRYHSLIVAPESLPEHLEVTARAESGEIMGVRHRNQATFGVQFHPESILTPHGQRFLANFLGVVEGASSC